MTKNSLYGYKKNGSPVHHLSFCAFLDVLGFTARTLESYLNGTGDELLREFHSTFSEVTDALKSQAEGDSPLYYKSFSDNVLLAVPQYSRDMESESGHILIAASEFQYQMALKGFFVRGGITVGPLYIDENSVYGGALISAHDLESKHADYPICVLCDETAKLVRKHLSYYGKDWAPQRRMILVDAKGRYFINYLYESVIDSDEGPALDAEALAMHRRHIDEALEKYSSNTSVVRKFEWLAAYHNYFCDWVSNLDGYTDTLRISSQPASTSIFRLPR